MNVNQQIDLLLHRLNWASVLAKERACNSIAELLANGQYTELVYQRLLKWLNEQSLESVCVYGLLAWLRAVEKGTSLSISSEEIWQAIKCPSILAWALLKELFPDNSIPFDEALSYTPEIPQEYRIKDFFEKYSRSYVPPIYAIRAEKLEQQHGFPFLRSWAYEWDLLVQKTQTKLSHNPLDFWLGHKAESDDYAYADSQISELYKSAYLRTLAKMVAARHIASSSALYLAIHDCPVDLDLWILEPNKKPEWWPTLENEQIGEIDLTIARVWQQVEQLWTERRINGAGKLLIHASGSLFTHETYYNLEILGFLQKAHGPVKPNFNDVAQWCKYDETNQAHVNQRSLFRFSGNLPSTSPNKSIQAFNDWSFFSLAQFSNPFVIARWQAWRSWRNVWLPNSSLFKNELSFQVQENAVVVYDQDRPIGEWRDWTDGITERQNRELPPQNGEYLTVDSQIIQDFMNATNSGFCWLCALTRYYRKDKVSGSYEKFTDYRLIGGSNIVRL